MFARQVGTARLLSLVCLLQAANCNRSSDGTAGSSAAQGGRTVAKSNMYGIIEEETPDAATKPANGPAQQRAWERVRAALAKADSGFAKRLEYCVLDREFVDPIVQRLIDKYYGGVIPTEEAKLVELIEYAQTDHAAAHQTPDGLRRLEKLLEKRFASPQVTQQGNRVVVDFGFLPGRMTAGPRARIGVSESSHVQDGQWKSVEVAQALTKYVAEQAGAAYLDLVVSLADAQQTRWTYSYDRAADRLYVFSSGMPTGAFVSTEPVAKQLGTYVAGTKSFATAQLRWERNAQVRR